MTLDTYLTRQPGRCPQCGHHLATQGCHCASRLRDAALSAVNTAADPDDRQRIDAAIRTVAARGREFSANTVRELVPNVPGPLMGARFQAAAKAGVITRVGYEPSTKGSTHAHPIATWKAAA